MVTPVAISQHADSRGDSGTGPAAAGGPTAAPEPTGGPAGRAASSTAGAMDDMRSAVQTTQASSATASTSGTAESGAAGGACRGGRASQASPSRDRRDEHEHVQHRRAAEQVLRVMRSPAGYGRVTGAGHRRHGRKQHGPAPPRAATGDPVAEHGGARERK